MFCRFWKCEFRGKMFKFQKKSVWSCKNAENETLKIFLPDPGTWGEDGGKGLAKSDSDVSMASATRLSASEACLELEDIRLEDRRVGVEGLDMVKD